MSEFVVTSVRLWRILPQVFCFTPEPCGVLVCVCVWVGVGVCNSSVG